MPVPRWPVSATALVPTAEGKSPVLSADGIRLYLPYRQLRRHRRGMGRTGHCAGDGRFVSHVQTRSMAFKRFNAMVGKPDAASNVGGLLEYPRFL